MLKIDIIKLVRTDIAFPSTFELDKDIHICVMPLNYGALSEEEKKSAINVKFLNYQNERTKQTKR